MMPAVNVLALCLLAAAELHHVPPEGMLALMEVEGGWDGAEILNKNGTKDLGVMQVNSAEVPAIAENWGVDRTVAHSMIRDNSCVNFQASAHILRQKIDGAHGNLLLGLAHYNSANPKYGIPYLRKVLRAALRQRDVLESYRRQGDEKK